MRKLKKLYKTKAIVQYWYFNKKWSLSLDGATVLSKRKQSKICGQCGIEHLSIQLGAWERNMRTGTVLLQCHKDQVELKLKNSLT